MAHFNWQQTCIKIFRYTIRNCLYQQLSDALKQRAQFKNTTAALDLAMFHPRPYLDYLYILFDQ